MITGEPGTGKSVTLRHLNDHLSNMQELAVRVITRPQSGIRDFYRELAELFDVPIRQNNRYGSFINLRKQWGSHIKSSLFRPVLLMDEAQEAHEDVLNELRLLSSVDLDSKNILAVVFACSRACCVWCRSRVSRRGSTRCAFWPCRSCCHCCRGWAARRGCTERCSSRTSAATMCALQGPRACPRPSCCSAMCCAMR